MSERHGRQGVRRLHPRRRGHGGGRLQPAGPSRCAGVVSRAWDDLDDVAPSDFTVRNVLEVLGDGDPWAAMMPEQRVLPSALVEEGRAIPLARVQAMHEGKRRARARQDDPD